MNLQVSVREKPAIHTRNHFYWDKMTSKIAWSHHISTNIAIILIALPRDSRPDSVVALNLCQTSDYLLCQP
jgi:hypothetical protein